jgi:tripartite-type tricarboxylate transporter receptor subunit TctC
VTKVTSQPEIRQLWGRQGATPMVMTTAAFDKYIQDDIAKWARVIHSAHITAE